jgi:hypothetical protein
MAVVESNGSEPFAAEALRERLEAARLNTSEPCAITTAGCGPCRRAGIPASGRPQKPSEYAQWCGKLSVVTHSRAAFLQVVEPQPEFHNRQSASPGTLGSGLGYLFQPRAYQDERSANAA